MRCLVLLLAVVLAAPALAQHRQGQQQARGQQMSHEERQRLRQDVDSARGNYNQRDTRRQERMAPEERAKLRRDVQDANRSMPKR
jgi:Ni/Co efflux regulator RcnB